jgi:membrane protease YdiL (CAAX protease family)
MTRSQITSGFHRSLARTVRLHPLAAFVGGTFLLSWGYWIPDAVAGGRWSHYPGLVGPALSAVTVSAICGRASVDALRARALRWRVALRWYAAALAPLVVAAAVVGVTAAFGTAPSLDRLSRVKGLPAIGWFLVALLMLVIDGFGEETGWRGFLWPRLRGHRSLVSAAAVLTIPWAIWHVPLFWIHSGFRGFSPVAVPGFVLSLFAGAVVLGWLFDKSASVAVVALWHAMLNMTTGTDAAGASAAVVSMLVIVMALAVVRHETTLRKVPLGTGRGAR